MALAFIEALRGKRRKTVLWQIGIFSALLLFCVLAFSSSSPFRSLSTDLGHNGSPQRNGRRLLDEFPKDLLLDAPTLPVRDPSSPYLEEMPCDCGPGGKECRVDKDSCVPRVAGNNSCPHGSAVCEMRIFYEESSNKYWLVLHFIGVLYMFMGLAIVCDDYFVAALEEMCERWHITEDVAGATFMAGGFQVRVRADFGASAGGSAPELFTSMIGVLVAESNVGFGTIVGSAVFNVLFVIGLCAIFAGQALQLTWWPLFRDCTFYSFGLGVLVYCVQDQKIDWTESVLLLACYVAYVVIMKFNLNIKRAVMRVGAFLRPAKKVNPEAIPQSVAAIAREGSSMLLTQPREFRKRAMSTTSNFSVQFRDMRSVALKSILAGRLDLMRKTAKASGVPSAPKLIALPDGSGKEELGSPPAKMTRLPSARLLVWKQAVKLALHEKRVEAKSADGPDKPSDVEMNELPEAEDDGPAKDVPEEGDGPDNIWEAPESASGRVFWAILLPLNVVMHYTIPNCANEGLQRYFVATFLMSLVWIAAFSFAMVWWASTIGYALGIPDAVMGLTILAGGTSIPDALSSVIVARNGFGDMAVSSSIGSNIFDINMGLPLPWFIKTVIIDPGYEIPLDNCGLLVSVVTLLLMVVFVIVSIICTNWRLDMRLGWIMFALYVLFVLQSLSLQYGWIEMGC